MHSYGSGGCLESYCFKKSHVPSVKKLYWKSYLFQVINWHMDSQDTANMMSFKNIGKSSFFSWFKICSVLASSIKYPKAICFLKSTFWPFLVKETFTFTPHFWAKLRHFCHHRLGAHFPAVCAVSLLSHQGCHCKSARKLLPRQINLTSLTKFSAFYPWSLRISIFCHSVLWADFELSVIGSKSVEV